MATVIVNCPSSNTGCGVVLDNETAVGNTGTIDFAADFSSTLPSLATFTLSQAFVTGGAVRSGWMRLTFWSDGDYGAAGSSTGTGTLGAFSCTGSAQILTLCYNNSLQPISLGQAIPISLQLQISRLNTNSGLSDGGGRELYLQAQFFENAGGQTGAPVAVSLLTPEPGSVWLCGAGLIAAGVLLRRTNRRRNRISAL